MLDGQYSPSFVLESPSTTTNINADHDADDGFAIHVYVRHKDCDRSDRVSDHSAGRAIVQ